MTSRYGITVASVRAVSGISTDFISDVDMGQLIDSAEYEADKTFNCKFVPTTFIEFPKTDNSERVVVKFNPLLRVTNLEIDKTTIDIEDIRVDKSSGVVRLEANADKYHFLTKSGYNNLTKIRYDYGLLEATSIQTDTITDSSIGSSTSISVGSSTGFTSGDFVQIEGFDGFIETFTINSIPDSTHMTADKLVTSHETGSLLTKVITPPIVIRLVQVITAMMGVARVVGASYTDIVGYSLGDMSIQKGEPYTQWRESTTQLTKEYKIILQSFRARPVVK